MSVSSFITIKDTVYGEHIASKSKFLSVLAPVKTEAEAEALIAKVKGQHKTATHNVFAYYVNNFSSIHIERYSDDGEPNKTAGVPILETLKNEKITDVCAVVTRYFGGTLLGTGGLVRAYTNAIKSALEKAFIVQMDICCHFSITIDYALHGKIGYIIPNYSIIIANTQFADMVTMELFIIKHEYETFINKITEICYGNLKIHLTDEQFLDIIK